MNDKKPPWQTTVAILALSAAGIAKADWLAADPGTKISLQMNLDGALVVRPIGGTWSHPVCSDVSAAEFRDTGWVRTDMGGPGGKISPEESIAGMRRVIAKLKPGDTGKFFNYDGGAYPW